VNNEVGRHVNMTGKHVFTAAHPSKPDVAVFLLLLCLWTETLIISCLRRGGVGGGEQMPRRDFNSRSVRERKDRYRRKR
jgi:hypothetical protein